MIHLGRSAHRNSNPEERHPMRKLLTPLALLLLMALPLTGCAALASMAGAARDSAALQENAEALDDRMQEVEAALKSYEDLAEDLGPDYKAKYDAVLAEYEKVKGYVAEGQSLLSDAKNLHERAMAEARDPDSGEVDWLKYGMILLAGGGGLYSERRRTKKEQEEEKAKRQRDRDRLHGRMDKRKDEVAGLKAELDQMKRDAEMEKARREGAGA